ncbi:MAG: hypothetical protein ACNFW9_00785 [Candidatus Kerfeldbacteria bacterium]|jgi:hypothetical protein
MSDMSCMVPREKVALRITTGNDNDQTVYVFGPPDKNEFRKVQRNDEKPFTAKIMGPVVDEILVDDVVVGIYTQLANKQVLAHKKMLEVGTPMGLWTEPDAKETRISRPIIKIEII